MAKLDPLYPEFVSSAGVFPSSTITLAMVRALDTADDNGRIRCSTQVFNKLRALGLAETRGWCDYITHAGWNVAAMFPLPEVYDPVRRPAPQHQTTTWQDSYELVWRPNPRQRNEIRQDPSSSWRCSCGAYGGGRDREEARRSARAHRGEFAAV